MYMAWDWRLFKRGLEAILSGLSTPALIMLRVLDPDHVIVGATRKRHALIMLTIVEPCTNTGHRDRVN